MGLTDEVTPSRNKAIDELRRRTINDCSPKMLEDEYIFYRFMKARNFNIQDAEAMLRKHIAWRKEYQIDTILTDYKPPEVLLKYGPTSFVCLDKEGSVVRYLNCGGSDSKGILNSCKKIDCIKHSCYLFEQDLECLKQQSKKLGKPVTTILYIQNYDKMTFAKATYRKGIEMLGFLVRMYQDNYPERVKAFYVINASVYFTALFSVIKPLIAPAIIEKVKVFGTTGWQEALLRVIDADELPAFLGGNRTDPDGNPLCSSFITHGRPIPESYYLTISKRTLCRMPGVKKKVLYPFSKTDIHFHVEEPGSILVWEFETKCKDIAFGVYFLEHSPNEDRTVEIVTKQRIDTCFETEAGMYKCEKSGTYTILFDNSYSWIHPKEIYYRARIIGPNEDESQKWK